MKIITGNTGMKHVTSDDDGAMYASIIGKQDYIFDLNDNFSHEILDTNTIKINSGDALLNGRHVRIPRGSYDLVTIDNGQTGYKRIDLITIRYESNGEIERAYLNVIKGTQTTGTATVPSYEKESILNGTLMHDLPLYEVHLNGINLDTVKVVFIAKDLSTTHLGYRPNLLINGDFRKPINQRGQTKYQGQATKGYTIDRWCMGDNDFSRTVEIVDGGVKITNPNTTYNGTFQQILENSLPLGTYTVTVKVTELNNNGGIFYLGGSASSIKKNLRVGINTLTVENATVTSVIIQSNPSSDVTIEWIKLEQGSIATPFVPRPYAEELALCKRYFERQYALIGMCSVVTSSQVFLMKDIRTKRVRPTISISSAVNINVANKNFSATYQDFNDRCNENNLLLYFKLADNGLANNIGDVGIVMFNNNADYIDFDSEMY